MFETENINGIHFLQIDGQLENGIILIFLTGIGTCKENYIEHLISFRSDYETIYTMDLPEQGSKGKWTIGNHVNNLKEFIRVLDNPHIRQIHLSGHSAGALAIISFLVNYNCDVENILLQRAGEPRDYNDLTKTLEQSGFGQEVPEAEKVSKLFLYAPPYSFNVVFPRKLSRVLERRSQAFIKVLFDIFINIPLLLLGFLGKNEYFRFSLNKSSQPQYFMLVLSNHKDFFNYVSRYETLFELFKKVDESLKIKVSKILEDKKILIQYGSIDWLLKPNNRKKKSFEDHYKMHSDIKVVRHKFLGHILNRKFYLNINLNRQMITNSSVIKTSKEF
jgi:pimeloyl-ACP methyl ester carboxylesterase